MQLADLPSERQLVDAYAAVESPDYLVEERGQRVTARVLLNRLERHVPLGNLLDAGCWLGFLADESRRRGWRAVGLEPSRFASDYARTVLGLDVRTGDLFSCELEPGSFDAVVLADVLEHLPDPGAALDRAAALTRPGGALLLTVPDAGSPVARALGRRWWSVIPTHVQYFTRRSLRTLLAGHGWELRELGTAPKAFSVSYYLERVGGYSSAASTALVRTAEAAGLADRLWAPDFRDRICAVASSADALPGRSPRSPQRPSG
jgi:SAM-dependent methyltransferase